jgi:hypothetical protein
MGVGSWTVAVAQEPSHFELGISGSARGSTEVRPSVVSADLKACYVDPGAQGTAPTDAAHCKGLDVELVQSRIRIIEGSTHLDLRHRCPARPEAALEACRAVA